MLSADGDRQPRGDSDPRRTLDHTRRGAVVCFAALLLVWAAFFARAVFTTGVFASRDMLQVYWPLRAFWKNALLAGNTPGWFPGEALGEPFIALGLSAPFHPLGLLALAMDTGAALKWMTLLALLLSLGGTFFLCREAGAGKLAGVLGACAYGLSGYLVGLTANQPYLLSAAALPWAIWAALRMRERPTAARLLVALLAVLLVLLGGDFQAYVVTLVAVPAVVLVGAGWKGRVRAALLLALVAFAGGCIQWLPGLLAGPGSMHLARMTVERAQWHSLHPLQLLDTVIGPVYRGAFEDDVSVFIARDLFGTGLQSVWVQSTYVGPLVLVLALAGWMKAPARHWLGAGAVLLLLLVLGRHVGLYGLLHHLPGWSAFRYPLKLFPFLVLALAVCCALGLARAEQERPVARALFLSWLTVSVACALAWMAEARWGLLSGLLVRSGGSGAPPGLRERLSDGIVSSTARVALVSTAAAVLMRAQVTPRLRSICLLALVLLDLHLANAGTYELVSRGVVSEPETASTILRALPPDPLLRPRVTAAVEQFVFPSHERRVDALVRARVTALENMSQTLWGLEGADMILPLGSWRLWKLQQQKQWWVLTGHRLYSVGYFLASDAVVQAMGSRAPPTLARFPADGLHLLRQDVLPRAYLARRSCYPDDAAVWERLHSPGFPVGIEAAASCGPASAGPDVSGRVNALRWDPDLLVLEVDSNGGELVVNEAWHPGWSARLDDRPVALERVNLVVRGVQVPPGLHRVELRFRTPGLAWGGAVSLCTVLGVVLAAIGSRLGRSPRLAAVPVP